MPQLKIVGVGGLYSHAGASGQSDIKFGGQRKAVYFNRGA